MWFNFLFMFELDKFKILEVNICKVRKKKQLYIICLTFVVCGTLGNE